jgi:hypothetical protein
MCPVVPEPVPWFQVSDAHYYASGGLGNAPIRSGTRSGFRLLLTSPDSDEGERRCAGISTDEVSTRPCLKPQRSASNTFQSLRRWVSQTSATAVELQAWNAQTLGDCCRPMLPPVRKPCSRPLSALIIGLPPEPRPPPDPTSASPSGCMNKSCARYHSGFGRARTIGRCPLLYNQAGLHTEP